VTIPEVVVGLFLISMWNDLLFDLGGTEHYVTMTERSRGPSPRGWGLVLQIGVLGVVVAGLEYLRRKVKTRILEIERELREVPEFPQPHGLLDIVEAAEDNPGESGLLFPNPLLDRRECELLEAWGKGPGARLDSRLQH
jgi:hypothetical protein